MIPWLAAGQPFPPVESALAVPNGLLAASSDVSAERVLAAYRRGIFPWYSAGEPVLWWSPDPRMVLYTNELRVSRSLGKALRRAVRSTRIELCVDRGFAGVMQACAEPREADGGTWITDAMVRAYSDLHRMGCAHSVETWSDGTLIGGLYGVSLGRVFFGESMFARAADASKIALALLVEILLNEQVRVIDCQQTTRHLASLGGREIARTDFMALLRVAVDAPPVNWSAYTGRPLNSMLAGLRID
jgi:leucyl/phenylalanyl-tRNA--protein transferase